MGFLDRMVSDLVKSSTGYNVRPLIRMLGAKRLLTLGGAAVAGAALSDRMQQRDGASPPPGPLPTGTPGPGPLPTSTPGPGPLPAAPPPPPGPVPTVTPTGAIPPPPPIPVAPPPPPPASPASPGGSPSAEGDQGGEASVSPALVSPALTLAGVRTVIAAALADGVLADVERAVIDQHLENPELSTEQAAQARADFDAPLAPAALAAMVDDSAGAEVLYRLAAAVILADDTVTSDERAWLDSFATALGFDAATKSAIEASLVFGR